MIRWLNFVRLAARPLRRGGQRIWVALLCIAFGVMSLVAMDMLAGSIESKAVLAPVEVIGGDLSLTRAQEDTLRPEDINQLDAFQRSGAIRRYTRIAFNSSSLTFRLPGSGEIHYIGNALGIEPEQYPLAGALVIGEPGSTGLPTLLQDVGDVVITRDIAEEYALKTGDRLLLADLRIGAPLEATVRGIAYDTPNHQGDKLYYSLETARRLADGQPVVNTVIANSDQAEALIETLESSGWAVNWAAGREDRTANVWMIGVRGAGILGLLVAGIGIANTMQVLLRRRQEEIAVWKTLGYRSSDLWRLFTLEAGLLGLVGSVIGAGLGVLISSGLLELFRRTSTLLYEWTLSPVPPLTGIMVGTLTTVIFAAWAIALSSQVRPAALLRSEPAAVQGFTGCQSIGLALILAALFTALTSLVMESVWAGIGMLVLIGSGLAGLAFGFRALLWICTHLLPLRWFPLGRLAFDRLPRHGFALVFAMIALFTGVVSMGLGMMVVQGAGPGLAAQAAEFQGYNLTILASANQENAIRQAVQAQEPEKTAVGYRTAVAGVRTAGNGKPLAATDAVLIGRSDPDDYRIEGAAWGSRPNGVYASRWANLEVGSHVEVTFWDGSTQTFPVVGSYDVNHQASHVYPPSGLLMPAETFTRSIRPDAVVFFVQVSPERLAAAETALADALPQATVINLIVYAGRFMRSYQNLYLLPLALAGLALLAGLLLVANSVSLAMLDRRYEIGILKTIGYARRQILTLFAVEYGLVGLLATAAGVLVIQGFLALLAIGSRLAAAMFLLNIPSLTVITVCSVGLTLLTVLAVAWGPTRASPVAVLAGEN